jgi:hypothetical protein
MGVRSEAKEEKVEFIGGYKLTFVSSGGEVIGVIIEGPKFPRPLYIPKDPCARLSVKLPENIRKFLIKEGFKL